MSIRLLYAVADLHTLLPTFIRCLLASYWQQLDRAGFCRSNMQILNIPKWSWPYLTSVRVAPTQPDLHTIMPINRLISIQFNTIAWSCSDHVLDRECENGALFDYYTIDGDGVTTVVGHEYVRSRLIPHVVVVSTTVMRCKYVYPDYHTLLIRLLYDLNTWIAYSSPVWSYAERMQLSHGFAYAWRRCQYDCYTLLPDLHTLLPTFMRYCRPSYASHTLPIGTYLLIGGGADRLRLFWNFQNSRSRRWLQYDSCRLARLSYVSTCTIADSPRSTRTAESWSIVAVSCECENGALHVQHRTSAIRYRCIE